jgi:hypothetical protein
VEEGYYRFLLLQFRNYYLCLKMVASTMSIFSFFIYTIAKQDECCTYQHCLVHFHTVAGAVYNCRLNGPKPAMYSCNNCRAIMAENIAECLMLPAILQAYAILVARLNAPLGFKMINLARSSLQTYNPFCNRPRWVRSRTWHQGDEKERKIILEIAERYSSSKM